MKFGEIKEPGWYWWRWDEHRYWEAIWVERERKNPLSSGYNRFYAGPNRTFGEFIGPLTPPPEGAGGPGFGSIARLKE